MKLLSIAAAAAAGLVWATPASATIFFATGNPGGGLDVVNLPGAAADDGSDFNLLGTVNPDDTKVFITGNENIDSAASGQARVIASNGSALNFLNLVLEEGFGADTFVFNLNAEGSSGTVKLFGVDQLGNVYESGVFALGNGQNFFNLTTGDDQLITRVYFESTALSDVRQIRYGGVVEIDDGGPGAGGIPEPSSWALMILGFGGAGALLRRRRGQILPA